MQIDIHGKLLTDQEIIKLKGLGLNGRVQKFIDNECIKQMDPYTPNRDGFLIGAARIGTVIGSGEIVQSTPYARYQYYGEKYVDPVYNIGAFHDPKTGRFWSRPGVAKIPSGIPLKYSKAKNAKAGARWFERMKADHKNEILKGAIKVAG